MSQIYFSYHIIQIQNLLNNKIKIVTLFIMFKNIFYASILFTSPSPTGNTLNSFLSVNIFRKPLIIQAFTVFILRAIVTIIDWLISFMKMNFIFWDFPFSALFSLINFLCSKVCLSSIYPIPWKLLKLFYFFLLQTWYGLQHRWRQIYLSWCGWDQPLNHA